jgi:simple sugar transport system permease protein
LIFNRHIFGDQILFIGDNIDTAHLMGINTDRVRMRLFVLMGMISALVSVMICLEMANWWPTQGEGYLLLVFASIFIGGTSVFGGEGTVFGALIGSIIIGIIEAGIISAGLSGFWTRLVHGLIIVVSVSVYARVFKSWR